MKIKEVIDALEMFAPLPLQDGFDNSGLQIGLTDAKVTGALLCLDVTEAIVDEAIALGFNLIVAHHPLIFKGYKSLTGKDYVERCIIKAVKHDIVIYAMHTNLDNAPQGVSYKIADKLGLVNVQPLEPKQDGLLKLVTFVPTAHVHNVTSALYRVGCGHIGAYDSCSYQLQGKGTFRALEGTHPFCGKIGELHEEDETRVEVVLPTYLQGKAERALIDAHPYEEPAYDFYALKNAWHTVGAGIIGELTHPLPEQEWLERVKQIFHIGCIKHSAFLGKPIQRVALCGGSGAFLLPNAVRVGADVFMTGDIKYHDYFFYHDRMLLADIGHYESEQYTMEIFRDIIETQCSGVATVITNISTNPINYL